MSRAVTTSHGRDAGRRKRLGALFAKEWRDHRTLILMCAALVPVAFAAIEWLYSGGARPRVTAGAVVPCAVTVVATILAADLFGADLVTGRAGTYAALPTTARTHFVVRTVFLGIVVTLLAAWIVACATGAIAVFGSDAALTALGLAFADSWWLMLFALPVGAATLLFSTLSQRGFAAVGAGAAVVAALGFSWAAVDWRNLEFVPGAQGLAAAGVFVAATLLVGAYLTWARAPAVGGSLVRRIALAAAVPAFVIPTSAAAGAAVLHTRAHVAVGDRSARAWPALFSPDGRFLVATAGHVRPAAVSRHWSFDLETGRVVQLGTKGQTLPPSDRRADYWDERGIRLTDSEQRVAVPDQVVRTLDLLTGEVVRTRSVGQLQAEGALPHPSRSAIVRPVRGDARITVTHPFDGTVVRLPPHAQLPPGASWSVPVDRPLRGVYRDGASGRLHLFSSELDAPRDLGVVIERPKRLLEMEGVAMLVRDKTWTLIDLATGTVTTLEDTRYVHVSGNGWFTARTGDGSPWPTWLVHPASGRRVDLAPYRDDVGYWVATAPDGTFATMTRGGDLVLIGPTGDRRVLHDFAGEETE